MAVVTLAVVQHACTWDLEANLATAERLVREAAARGAQVVLLPELFATPYFCLTEDARHYGLARPLDGHPVVGRFAALAAALGVVLPLSVFERAGQACFNTTVVVDADGRVAGRYRKSHVPQFPGYEEKYYFSPGDTGFRPLRTRYAALGVGVCWDQWFPEAARCLVLRGAEVLLFPTAIGSDPPQPDDDSRESWQLVQRGHAVANRVPLAAANRVGIERAGDVAVRFYGSSFICDHRGRVLAELGREEEGVAVAALDLEAARRDRDDWGFFRDRRPDLYGPLLSLDGGGAG